MTNDRNLFVPESKLRDLITDANGTKRLVTSTVTRAVDMLLDMHASTGLDLTNNADALLNLVLLVYPDAILVGTGPEGEHVMHAPYEVGAYSLTGDKAAMREFLSAPES